MTKTIAEQLAAEAKELTFSELPPEVIHRVKRSMLDTLGVGFGGYLSEPSQIIQSMIREMNGPGESTVFGSGLKTSCLWERLGSGLALQQCVIARPVPRLPLFSADLLKTMNSSQRR